MENISRRAALGAFGLLIAAPTRAENTAPPASTPDATSTPEAAPAPAARRYWPIVTSRANALSVPMNRPNAEVTVAPGRGFSANRDAGEAAAHRRHHVGIDLYARAGDRVIAIEAGRIIAFYPFYASTYAMLIAHPGYVANYGELRADALSAQRLRVGSQVRAGQRIGHIGATGALHFELYRPSTQRNAVWRQNRPLPANALNPTPFLLALAREGVRVRP